MKITTHISNLIFLWRENKKQDVNLNLSIKHLLSGTKHQYKIKNSWVRNQVALLIRKIRKEKPYQVIDYSKAKELYDNIVPIDLSEVKVGSYVFKFTVEESVKGERWCEYFINERGTVGVYKVHKYDESYNYWSLENYDGNWNHFTTLSKKSLRSFRFATKEEIEQFKIARKNYKQKKKEIEALQKQINKLYKQL